MKRKQFCSFLAAVLVLTVVGSALYAESIYSVYERKAKDLDPNNPAEQRMMTLWCADNKLKNQYILHYRLFLKSRGENTRKKNPDGYCAACNGEEEYVCDACDTHRRVGVKCSKCAGTGTISCFRCKGRGEVTCPRCRGRGKRRKTEITAGIGGRIRTSIVDCPQKIRCGRCKGEKTRLCRVCDGSTIEKKYCTVCDKYRFRKCSECREQREEFSERVLESSLAAAETPPLDPIDKKKEVPATDFDDKKEVVPPSDLDDLEGAPLVKKGKSLMAEGLVLDRQALTSKAPYPLMRKAAWKYEEAVKCYKAAQKKECNVDAELQEALMMLYWVRKMTPIR